MFRWRDVFQQKNQLTGEVNSRKLFHNPTFATRCVIFTLVDLIFTTVNFTLALSNLEFTVENILGPSTGITHPVGDNKVCLLHNLSVMVVGTQAGQDGACREHQQGFQPHDGQSPPHVEQYRIRVGREPETFWEWCIPRYPHLWSVRDSEQLGELRE